MAEEPEQLGLANKDQAAQDKALDQLTDHVSSDCGALPQMPNAQTDRLTCRTG